MSIMLEPVGYRVFPTMADARRFAGFEKLGFKTTIRAVRRSSGQTDFVVEWFDREEYRKQPDISEKEFVDEIFKETFPGAEPMPKLFDVEEASDVGI